MSFRVLTILFRRRWIALYFATLAASLACAAQDIDTPVKSPTADFSQRIKPLLSQYCFECHGDGASKGGLALDSLMADDAMLQKRDVWLKILKNVRANLMPPAKSTQLKAADRSALERGIKYTAFGIDPKNPDPGRVTLHRLNRSEYSNTIRDLMGVEFKADEEFPPDDTGYGFDNIGDALNVSPLLMEKYMQAAENIVTRAVPATSRAVSEITISGSVFRGADDKKDDKSKGRKNSRESRALPFTESATVSAVHTVKQAGTYRLGLDLKINGSFDFDPQHCTVTFSVSGPGGSDAMELLKQEFAWQDGKVFHYDFDQKWQSGERTLSVKLTPVGQPEKRSTHIDLKVVAVQIRGPLEPEMVARPENFDRFFSKDAPAAPAERLAYAQDVLRRFATKAFRRPVDERTLGRLLKIAETGYTAPNKTFEQGVAQAMIAVLASPRFLFRMEETVPNSSGKDEGSAFVDDYALASRLSYFLWSTMPDAELIALAEKKQLRANLPAQMQRLLTDSRSEAFVDNFVGQWLQARDVSGISIDPRVVLARDAGTDKELTALFKSLQAIRAKREDEMRQLIQEGKPIPERLRSPEEEKLRARLKEMQRGPTLDFDGALRTAMRRETELFFDSIMRENRSVLDMLDSDYTFLNERLAKHYGIPGVTGERMRRVTLPPDSPRGGILTQGTLLVVTSNPTRTSPVKRGLFLLDNILGSPTRPAPPEIPALEASEDHFEGKEPSLREVLEVHRAKPLCSSCHNQMDPLGLAFENFNALGIWRSSERKVPIDAASKLVTGEAFDNVRALKKILKTQHRAEFYRCLTEKCLTYALGRGLEYYDVETVDRIVDGLEKEDGKFSALMTGIVESVPFQKRRTSESAHEKHAP